jgi:hypothetical protein
MSKYIMEVTVDTEAAEIDDTREAAYELVRSAINEAACLDSDQVFVFEARELEDSPNYSDDHPLPGGF